MADHLGGTTTILFTDIVGSTALGDRLGDDKAQALRRAHDRILRAQFERFAGTVIKGTGDGFMVAFASARQGIECAAGVQRALAAEHSAGRYAELHVRAGLHTGEPVEEEGDLLGSDANLAARVAAEAEGGQVVISDVTRLLARQSRNLEFVALGERQLRGFSDPVALYEVRWPAERTERRPKTPFVGRVRELGQIQARLDQAAAGQGSIVCVGGEPGAGKTRLVSEVATHATDRGWAVLTGHAYEADGMPPYLPFVEALSAYLRSRSSQELSEKLSDEAPYLAKLLPQIRERIPELGEPPPLSPEAERYRLFDAVSELLLRVAADGALLLFLDDLHWADEGTLLLLEHLSRRTSEGTVLVAATFRDTEVDDRHPLTRLLGELDRQQIGETLLLPSLSADEAAGLVEAACGVRPAPAVRDRIAEAAAGNPLFALELTRHLQEQGRDLASKDANLEDWDLPSSVRQVIGKRVAKLSENSSNLLTYAALLGGTVLVSELVAVSGVDEDATLDALDEAVTASLLVEQGYGYAFSHPLVQETLYRELSAPRRRQLHRRAGEALERLYREAPQRQHLSELARHFAAALPGGDAQKAIEYGKQSAESALAQFAYEEAARLYDMVLDVIAAGQTRADDSERCTLLLALGEAQRRGGQPREAMETYQRAAGLANESGTAVRLAEAAIGFFEASWLTGQVERDEAGQLLEEATNAVGDSNDGLKARLLVRHGRVIGGPGRDRDREQGLSLVRQSVELARHAGETRPLAEALNGLGWVMPPRDYKEKLENDTESIALAMEIGDTTIEFLGRAGRIDQLMAAGNVDGVDAEIEIWVRRSVELREPFWQWYKPIFQSMRAIMTGRFRLAEELVQEAIAAGRRANTDYAVRLAGLQMIQIRREQGRLAEIENLVMENIAREAERNEEALGWSCFIPVLHLELGRPSAARTELDRLAANEFTDVRSDSNWITALTFLAEVSYELEDTRRAARLYDLLLPYANQTVFPFLPTICAGSVAHFLGLLATCRSRWPEAERHFDEALRLNGEMRAPPLVARTQGMYAETLLKRNSAGDRTRAQRLLEAALTSARKLEMAGLADRLQKTLQDASGG